MAAKYLMQAKDSIQGLVTWASVLPDWAALGSPGIGTIDPGSVAISGGGFETPDSVPDGAYVFDDGSIVVFDDGSIAVTA